MRLSTRIALLCAAAVLPSLGMQVWHEAALRASRAAEVRAEATRFALQSAAELERVLDGAEQLLRAVGVAAARHDAAEGCRTELDQLRRAVGRYTLLGYADSMGRVLCHSGGEPPVEIADRSFFQEALAQGGRSIGAYQIGRVSGRPTLPVALAVGAGAAGPLVAIATIDLAWLSANLASNIAVPPGGSVTVADRDGVILARTPLPERFVGTRIPEAFSGLLRAAAPGAVEVTSQDGTRRVLGFVPVSTTPHGLYVSAGFSTEAAYAAMNQATLRAGGLILLSLLSALLAAWLFGRAYLRAPLIALIRTMRHWTSGDRQARMPAEGGWEVDRLAAGFNAMADAVAAREAALEASEARLRAVLEALPVGVVLAEVPGGRLLYRNAAALQLLGASASDPAGPLPLADPLRRAVQEGRATNDLELPLLRPDGSETVISVSAAPLAVPGGPPLAVAAFLDVGARRHAERQQALLTAELRHRVKNALAVVQAVAAQTASASTSLEQFKASFGARLRDLARAQDALFAAEDGRVRLGWLVETALAPFATTAVSVAGPEVALPAKQTLAMALVLHEMATNAAKHGALRPGGAGRLDVTWQLRGGAAGEGIVLSWRETRPGEEVAMPETGRGFGARLIERCVAHDLRGRASWRVEPGALVWEIAFPVPAQEPLPEPVAA